MEGPRANVDHIAGTGLTGVRVPLSPPKLLLFLLIQAVCLGRWLRENFLIGSSC